MIPKGMIKEYAKPAGKAPKKPAMKNMSAPKAKKPKK